MQLALHAAGAQLTPNPTSGPAQHTQLLITDGEAGVVQPTTTSNQLGPTSSVDPGPCDLPISALKKGNLFSYRRSNRLAAKNKEKKITSLQRAQEIMRKKFKLANFTSKLARMSSTSSSAGASSSANHSNQPPSQQVANILRPSSTEA